MVERQVGYFLYMRREGRKGFVVLVLMRRSFFKSMIFRRQATSVDYFFCVPTSA